MNKVLLIILISLFTITVSFQATIAVTGSGKNLNSRNIVDTDPFFVGNGDIAYKK